MAPIGLLRRAVHRGVYRVPNVAVPQSPPAGYDGVELRGKQGAIHAWWYSPEDADENTPILVYFHGNAENLATVQQNKLFESWSAYGMRVVSMDYPGYGQSEGRPDQDVVLESGALVLRHVRERFPAAPVVIAGWSLGAAVALSIAHSQPRELTGVILLSAWCALRDVAMDHYPRSFVRWLMPDHYRSIALVKDIELPCLVLHGTEDWIVAPSQGARIAEFLPNARWMPIPNFEHNDILTAPRVWSEVGEFLHEILGPGGT